MDGMILQITCADGKNVQVSDGMNTCYLNVSRGKQTVEALCRKINKSATITDLVNSIFVISDFMFDFDWDYDNKKLMVSIETEEFDFLHPGAVHERVFRSKDLTSVLGNLERESLKRHAMKKRLQESSFVGIDMGELMGITSSGGVVVEEELKVVREAARPNSNGVIPLTASDIANLGGIKASTNEETTPLDKCLMRKGWLTFPFYESDSVPSCGDLYETFEEFLDKCKRRIIRLPRRQGTLNERKLQLNKSKIFAII